MVLNDWIGIAGLLATIIFGWLSIGLYNRKKYPGKISYVKLAVVNLLNDIANNFKDIRLLHNNHPIKNNLVYLKGAFINNGDIDIKTLIGENSITLSLPTDYKWMDFTITSHSDDLDCRISQTTENKEKISFDIFKKDEFIIFEGLIDAPQKIESKSFEDIVKFNHRIENTSKINVEAILDAKSLRSKSFMRKILSLYIVSGLLLVLLALVMRDGSPLRYHFMENMETNYSAYITQQNEIVLKETSSNFFANIFLEIFNTPKEISKDEFCNSYEISTYHQSGYNYIIVAELVVLLLLAILIIGPNYMQVRKTKRINKILQNHS